MRSNCACTSATACCFARFSLFPGGRNFSIQAPTFPLCVACELHSAALNIELLCIHSGDWTNRIGKHFSLLFPAHVIAYQLTARRLVEASCWFNIDLLRSQARRVGIDCLSCGLALENSSRRRREFLCVPLRRS